MNRSLNWGTRLQSLLQWRVKTNLKWKIFRSCCRRVSKTTRSRLKWCSEASSSKLRSWRAKLTKSKPFRSPNKSSQNHSSKSSKSCSPKDQKSRVSMKTIAHRGSLWVKLLPKWKKTRHTHATSLSSRPSTWVLYRWGHPSRLRRLTYSKAVSKRTTRK